MSDPTETAPEAAPKNDTKSRLDKLKQRANPSSRAGQLIKELFTNFGKMSFGERIKLIGKIIFTATLGRLVGERVKKSAEGKERSEETESVSEEDAEEDREDEGSAKTDKPEEPNQSIDPNLVGPVPGGVEPLCRRGKVVEDHTHNAKLLEVDPKRIGMLNKVIEIYKKHKERYEKVAQLTGIPGMLICAIHYREGSNKFDRYLHNGQKLGKPTTYVPKGILFQKGQWEEAAAHALGGDVKDSNGKPSLKSFRRLRDKFGLTADTKDMGAMMAFSEYYNGLGYRRRGIRSCYVYAGTNLNQPGRYVADGKFDPKSVDKRLGTAAILMGIQASEAKKSMRIAGQPYKNDNQKNA